MGRMCVVLLSGGLVLAPLTAVAGGPVGATLQTEGNAGLAVAGNVLPARLSVVVTKSNGRPATGFAPNGNNVLPAGWSLVSGFNVPPGGCGTWCRRRHSQTSVRAFTPSTWSPPAAPSGSRASTTTWFP